MIRRAIVVCFFRVKPFARGMFTLSIVRVKKRIFLKEICMNKELEEFK